MLSSWYVLFIRGLDEKAKRPKPLPVFPNVGERIVHYLGKSEDQEKQKADKENPLWPKIQDGVRPAWAPDFLRLGYAVVFNRAGFPKLAVRLGIKNPVKMREERGGVHYVDNAGKRVLTFDDAWVVGVDPVKRPMPMPSLKLDDEDWWLAMAEAPRPTSPFIVPGGVEVVVGAQRLADIVTAMLATPEGMPQKPLPSEEIVEGDDYSEFVNPLVPVRYQTGAPSEQERLHTGGRGARYQGTGKFAGLETFRY